MNNLVILTSDHLPREHGALCTVVEKKKKSVVAKSTEGDIST